MTVLDVINNLCSSSTLRMPECHYSRSIHHRSIEEGTFTAFAESSLCVHWKSFSLLQLFLLCFLVLFALMVRLGLSQNPLGWGEEKIIHGVSGSVTTNTDSNDMTCRWKYHFFCHWHCYKSPNVSINMTVFVASDISGKQLDPCKRYLVLLPTKCPNISLKTFISDATKCHEVSPLTAVSPRHNTNILSSWL